MSRKGIVNHWPMSLSFSAEHQALIRARAELDGTTLSEALRSILDEKTKPVINVAVQATELPPWLSSIEE